MVANIYSNQKLPKAVKPSCPNHKVLKDQAVLVTGANSGIGQAVAIAMGRAGAKVAINCLKQRGESEGMIQEIERCGGKAFGIRADVSKETEVKHMFGKMFDEYGTIDVLVDNAGLQQDAAFDEMTLDQRKKVIDVNLTGQFLCAREAVEVASFRIRGGRMGHAVNIWEIFRKPSHT